MPRTSKEITIKKLLEFASTYITDELFEVNKSVDRNYPIRREKKKDKFNQESRLILDFIKYVESNRNN